MKQKYCVKDIMDTAVIETKKLFRRKKHLEILTPTKPIQ